MAFVRSFVRSEKYYARKIILAKDAIERTVAAIERLTDQRQIKAHIAQISSYREELQKIEYEYIIWKNKQRNIDYSR